MKTLSGAPHFLRVTQALAFVSLSLPFLAGCGGKQLGEDNDAAIDCEGGQCEEASQRIYGTQPGPEVPDANLPDGVGACECGATAEAGDADFETSFGSEGGGPLDPPDLPA